jgi:hypothetical protein
MADSSESIDELEPGDFLYQSDQELFLVVTGETEDGYRLAAHGWREISKERLAKYVDGEHGKLHTSDEIEEIIEEEGERDIREGFARLKSLFESYADSGEIVVDDDFVMEDT